MAIDIEKDEYKRLLKLTKTLDNTEINLPIAGEQNKYDITANYKPKEKFMALANRKGHINVENLTFIMRSNAQGIMMRFDVCGAPHNNIPTPHLHVFDGEHNFGWNVISYEDLPNQLQKVVSSPAHLIENLEIFLEFNNISLKGIQINNNLL